MLSRNENLKFDFDEDLILQPIFLASPSFKIRYEKDLPKGIYGLFSLWAENLIESFQENRREELINAFILIERLHKNSNREIQEAATIGILEAIQNISMNNGINPDVFLPYLGEESTLWWQALNDFWSGKKSRVCISKQP